MRIYCDHFFLLKVRNARMGHGKPAINAGFLIGRGR